MPSSVLLKTKRLIGVNRYDYTFNILLFVALMLGSYILFYARASDAVTDASSYQLDKSEIYSRSLQDDKDLGRYPNTLTLPTIKLQSRQESNIEQTISLQSHQESNIEQTIKLQNPQESNIEQTIKLQSPQESNIEQASYEIEQDENLNIITDTVEDKEESQDSKETSTEDVTIRSTIGVKGVTGHFNLTVKTQDTKEAFLNMTCQQQAPLVPDQPIFVHLLGYQRTGSSFTDDILDRTPDIFCMYEPLMMLYEVMYATKHNAVTPNAIFNMENGMIRTIPEAELKMVAWTLESIFTCQMSRFTAPMLLDPWWDNFAWRMTSVPNYLQCLERQNVNSTQIAELCLSAITPKYCLGAIHPDSNRGKKCFSMLVGDGKFRTSSDFRAMNKSGITEDFINYTSCFEKYESIAKQCAEEYLDTPCKQSRIRALKTVRASMPVVTYFLDKFPNYRLVHLFRDPRAVVRSRNAAPIFAQSGYEKHNISRMAELYCRDVLADYKLGLNISESYPGKMLQILYDVVMKNLIQNVRDLYQQFLGFDDIPKATLQFIKKSDAKSKSSTEKWRSEFTTSQISDINFMCKTFMEEIKYDWT